MAIRLLLSTQATAPVVSHLFVVENPLTTTSYELATGVLLNDMSAGELFHALAPVLAESSNILSLALDREPLPSTSLTGVGFDFRLSGEGRSA